jgi:ribosomal protein L30E
MENDISLLGLAKKAGLALIGDESVSAGARTKKARLILTAADASDGSKRRARGYGETYGVMCAELPYTKAELGAAMGRSELGVLALTDAGLASKMLDRLAASDGERYGEAAEQMRIKAEKLLRRKREAAAHKRNVRMGKRRAKQ